MKKLFALLVAVLGLAVLPAHAYDSQRIPLAIAFDLDGEAADADQVVVSATLADSTTFTVAASPDTCRLVDITVTDADSSITAGVLTVTGTDCWGDALVATYTFAAGGSGVKTLSVDQTAYASRTARFATITSVVSGVLTGEGVGDALTVGYTANSDYTYVLYGIREKRDGRRFVNPFRLGEGVDDVTVNATALASYTTADGGAFQNLAVGDLVYLTVGGVTYERKLTAVSSDDAATIDYQLPVGSGLATTDRVNMQYKKRFLLAEADDGWFSVKGAEALTVIFDVDANADTGGVVSSVECAAFNQVGGDIDAIFQEDTATVNSGSAGQDVSTVDLRLKGYTHCRVGVKFGTGDDGDTANEDINVIALVQREQN